MHEPARDQDAASTYFPVDLESFDSSMAGIDLYLKHGSSPQPTLYCAKGAPLTPSDRARLLQQDVKTLYVPLHQHAEFRRIVLDVLSEANDSQADRRRRVRAICEKFLREALDAADRPETTRVVSDIARRMGEWLAHDEAHMLDLLDMSRHDFRIATHMLNVGLSCGVLMRRVSPDNSRQIAGAVEGGMLHDIGKRCLDESLLNKQGALTPVEWESIRRHPLVGHDELARRAGVSEAVLEMVRDHHERLDGAGYPNGLTGDQIGLYARVCAIADVFDAVASSRPYRKAMHPLDALDLMREGVGAHFDPILFEVWCAIVYDTLQRTPADALPERAGGDAAALNLAKVRQWGPDGMAPIMQGPRRNRAREGSADRRINLRKPWRTAIPTTILTRNKHKANGAPHMRSVVLKSVDISVGGIQLVTPWAFAQGDLLLLQLPGRNGNPIIRHGRVVRVRQRDDGQWIAGCEFIVPVSESADHADAPRDQAA